MDYRILSRFLRQPKKILTNKTGFESEQVTDLPGKNPNLALDYPPLNPISR
jgi:hypothetical protein